jgi:triosephosphate isomerase (TIM)
LRFGFNINNWGNAMTPRRPLVAGNWKMNGLAASAVELAAVKEWAAGTGANIRAQLLICPPVTLVASFARLAAGTPVDIGAQDCHVQASGAYTGDISPEMLADAGAKFIIVGHSERRAMHGECDRDVKAKAEAVHRAGLVPIVCLGESLGERRMGLTLAVAGRQLRASLPNGATAANTVIAYEPVWAIGTGLTPTSPEIAEVHAFLRAELAAMVGQEARGIRLLYGGSVKPSNAAGIFGIDHVDGGLIGGASLKATDFTAIAAAYLA